VLYKLLLDARQVPCEQTFKIELVYWIKTFGDVILKHVFNMLVNPASGRTVDISSEASIVARADDVGESCW